MTVIRAPRIEVRTMNEGSAHEFERTFLYCPNGHEVGSATDTTHHPAAWARGDFSEWECCYGSCGWGK